ncbi:MAG: galactose ABC transporter substrate-binding protein [Deltaproteobacteria bacterium]|jgi:methyl-galactoside transport system substrate-binding protein|nr:galactose ABC transporter substrate-binding protein [Deltaproteobacteria bacterium]
MKNTYLNLWRQTALAALTVLCLTLTLGCGDDNKDRPAKTEQAKPCVGVLLYREDDVYISMVNSALRAALGDQVRVEVLAAKSDHLTQMEQLDELLNKKVNTLVVNLVDTQTAAVFLDKAKKASIPIIFFNREPDLSILRSYAGKTCFVGTNTEDAGKMQGDMIKKLWDAHPEFDRNKDGKFQYIMLQANPDNPEAVARTEYSVRQAVEKGLPMAQLGLSYMCEWDENLAKQAMSLAMAEHGTKIELVIANNDSMALGAVAALAENGYNAGDKSRFIPVVGVDAIPKAVEAIRQGTMSATVKQDAEAMGKAVAAIALNAVSRKPLLENTAYAWDNSGIAVRIPYAPFDGGQ